jgi:DNA-binding HxlR family transcriptional regulator
MARTTRTYGHFCTLARALELVGDRWTMLVVRDLLVSPRRFTDLMERLGGITPKTLSERLKDLEAEGLVSADREPGRREVWYALTPAGLDLAPAIEELAVWGLRHARRPPAPGEPVHPEHLLKAMRIVLERSKPPAHPVRWEFQFVDDGTYTLAFEAGHWQLTDGGTEQPDVVVTTTRAGWARYVTSGDARREGSTDVEMHGPRRATAVLRRAIAAFPHAVDVLPAVGARL